MADPGYDPSENMFGRIGRQVFGTERDVGRTDIRRPDEGDVSRVEELDETAGNMSPRSRQRQAPPPRTAIQVQSPFDRAKGRQAPARDTFGEARAQGRDPDLWQRTPEGPAYRESQADEDRRVRDERVGYEGMRRDVPETGSSPPYVRPDPSRPTYRDQFRERREAEIPVRLGQPKVPGDRPSPPTAAISTGEVDPERINYRDRENPWLQKPGGARFGGETHGGYKTKGNLEGPDAPLQTNRGFGTHDQPQPQFDPTSPGDRVVNRNPDRMERPEGIETEPGSTRPTAHDEGQGTGQRITGPAAQAGRPPAAGGGARGGGGGGGAGGAAGGRKALNDRTRIEAYDPEKDRADPRNVAPVDAQGRANPKLWEQAQKGAIDPSAPGVKTGEAAAKFTNHYTSALAGATQYMTEMFHQKPGDPNQSEGYQAMTMKGVGAPDQQTVNAVFQVVDPRNELEPKERMELATRAMHDWYAAKGDQKSANKVSAEMLQYGNKQAQVYGKQLVEAIKKGDRGGAMKALQQAYAWLPDGMHVDVQGNMLKITDSETGKVVDEIELNDKKLLNLGVGLASGMAYWETVGERAGQKGKFAPPATQPTQAIAAQPPAGPAAPAAAPTAPAAGPPPAALPAPAPTRPAPSSGPPQPVTPPGNRLAAPAPAAPGPAAPQQAAPATPPQGGGEPSPAPAMETKPPPTLTPAPAPAPAAPAPAPAPAPKPAETKPTETPTAPPAAKPAEPKPAEPKPAEPKPTQGKLVWDDKDPDAPPKLPNGQPHIVRRATYPKTDDVKKAERRIAELNTEYQQELKAFGEDMATPGLNLKDREVDRRVKTRQHQMELYYKDKVKEQQSIIKTWREEEKEHDKQEKADLKWTPLKGREHDNAVTEIDAKLEGYVKQGEKWNEWKANPLRLRDKPETWGSIRDTILAVKALNPKIPTAKITDQVLTMMTHLGDDDTAKKETVNGQVGEKGSRFTTWGEDLARNPVVKMVDDGKVVMLHIPEHAMNEINSLKGESFRAMDKARTKAKQDEANAIQWGALVPDQVRNIGKYRGAQIEEMTKDAPTREKEATVKRGAGAAPPDVLTPTQRIEWERQQRKKNEGR